MPTNTRPHREARRRQSFRPSRRRQHGVVVLTFLFFALSVSSYVLLQALNTGAERLQAQQATTRQALTAARRALLGYAASYADGTRALNKGPGHLPCPDRAGGQAQGIAEAECRQTSAAETGLLPYRSLGLTALEDGGGAPLWYAVSEAHRSAANPPLNSETAGTLRVDGRDDVVAVIIAPGAALGGQNRSAANAYTAAAWLEGDNASAGDGSFRSLAAGEFNDQVVAITRGELAAVMEKTVLGDVAQALESYFTDPDGNDDINGSDLDCLADGETQTCDDGLPWLALQDNDTNYPGVVTNFAAGPFAAGRLPLVLVDGSTPVSANFLAGWHIDDPAASYTASIFGGQPPSEECLRHHDCTATYMVGAGPVSVQPAPLVVQGAYDFDDWLQGECTLGRAAPVAPQTTGELTLRCTAQRTFEVTNGGTSWDVRRTYALELPAYVTLERPTVGMPRTLAVRREDSWGAATPAVITVSDFQLMPAPVLLGMARLTVTSMSLGDELVLERVPFDLEISSDATIDRAVSPGELPRWFWDNNWARQIFVQYAQAESPGNPATDCASDLLVPAATRCLSLDITRPGAAAPTTQADVRAVVLAAGPALTAPGPAQTRPSAARGNYLEGLNATAGTRLEQRQADIDFNDQLRVLFDAP